MKRYTSNRSNGILTITLRAILPTVLAFAVGCKHSPFQPGDTGDPKTNVDTHDQPTSTNEPKGFTPVANRGFAELVEDNWIYGGDAGAFKVMSDGTAPQSKPSIGHITIPAGFSSGASPVHFERTIRDADQVYANFWFKVSADWEFNPVYDALIAVWGGDQPKLFFGWRPDANGQGMHPAALVSTSTVEGGSLWLDANLAPSTTISPGPWHHVEMLFESKAGATGTFNLWLDGTKISSFTNVPYHNIEEGRHWGLIQLGPSWGGLTPDPLSHSQVLDIDHIYMSAKPLN